MKETTYTKLLESILTSGKNTKDIIEMLELLRKMRSSQKVMDIADAVLIGTKLHYLKSNDVEDLT